MNRGACVHWNGLRGEETHCCDAGVNYHQAFDGAKEGLFLRLPCVRLRELPADRRGTYIRAGERTVMAAFDRRGQAMMPCDKYLEPTEEEVQKSREDSDASLARTLAAVRVASTWRVRPKPLQTRHGVVECPICKGQLHLTQSAHNGHVHGTCETDGCVAWME